MTGQPDMFDLMAPEDVAAALKVAVVTVYSWARRGLLPHHKLGRCVRFARRDVAEFVRRGRVEGGR